MSYDSRSPIILDELDSIIENSEDANAAKERRVIEENRCKLCEYIHDVTLLFPYMREKRVFTRDDCDIVKSEITSTMRVSKFLDIMLTKGPSAIGHFHLALEAHYQGVFAFLVQLFTNARVELPSSRQLKGELLCPSHCVLASGLAMHGCWRKRGVHQRMQRVVHQLAVAICMPVAATVWGLSAGGSD